MKQLLLTALTITAFLISTKHIVHAQWTLDSTKNTVVDAGPDVNFKAFAADDGGVDVFVLTDRFSTAGPQIKLIQLDPAGAIRNTKIISTNASDEAPIAAVRSGDFYYIATSEISIKSKLLLRKVSLNGVTQTSEHWSDTGVVVMFERAEGAAIAPDGNGGCYIAWNASRMTASLFTQHVSSSGELLWADSGYSPAPYGSSPTLIADGQNGFIMSYWFIHPMAVRIAPDGSNLWGREVDLYNTEFGGAIFSNAPVTLASDGAHGATFALQEKYTPGSSQRSAFFAQRVDSGGVIRWGAPALTLYQGESEVAVQMCTDGAQGAWYSYLTPGYFTIQHILADSTRQFPGIGKQTYQISNGQQEMSLTPSGDGGFYMSMQTFHSEPPYGEDLEVMRFDREGNAMWAQPSLVSTNSSWIAGHTVVLTSGGSVEIFIRRRPTVFETSAQAFSAANGYMRTSAQLSVYSKKSDAPQFYPNPFTTATHATLPEGAREITLRDMLGRTVRRERAVNAAITLERGSLPAGTYYYSITREKALPIQGMLVIE